LSAVGLRPAVLADAAAIGAVHVESWRETYSGLLPDAMLAELSVERWGAMWAELLGDPGTAEKMAILVAEEEGRIVGIGGCGPQRDEALAKSGFTGEFGMIYVLRSHQGRGLGRSIMASLARSLAKLGHDKAGLWVFSGNERARRFYERLGGAIVGEKAGERDGTVLVDLAYGWPDLSRLAAACGPGLAAPGR
jgi:GNAT superfamily N-acetyltransferase